MSSESLEERAKLDFEQLLTLQETKEMFSEIARMPPKLRGLLSSRAAFNFGPGYDDKEREWTTEEEGNIQTTVDTLLTIEYSLLPVQKDYPEKMFHGMQFSKPPSATHKITTEEWELIETIKRRVKVYFREYYQVGKNT